MFQLSITATLTNRYYHIRLSKIPKKFPCIPQLIMKRLYEFRGKILLHQEVMIFKGVLYTVMTEIVQAVTIKLNPSTFTQEDL